RDVADVLGKVPVVTLDIRRSVGPVAVELILGLGEDGGTGALGALEVLVDVVNVDVHILCHVAEALRVLKLGARVPHHHDTCGQLHLPCTQGARDLARQFGRSNSNVATPYSGVGAILSKVGAAGGSCGRSL